MIRLSFLFSDSWARVANEYGQHFNPQSSRLFKKYISLSWSFFLSPVIQKLGSLKITTIFEIFVTMFKIVTYSWRISLKLN